MGGRNINIVRTGKVVIVRRAQEAVAIGQNLQHSLSKDMPFLLALGLQDLEDQVLLAQAAGAGKIEGTGDLGEFGYVFLFEFRDCHSFTYGRFRIDKGGAPFRLEAREKIALGVSRGPARPSAWRDFQEVLLCSLTVLFRNLVGRDRDHRLRIAGLADTRQYFVHGFLDARVRPMKLTGGLRHQLAEHVPVPHRCQRFMNQMRTHKMSLLFFQSIPDGSKFSILGSGSAQRKLAGNPAPIQIPYNLLGWIDPRSCKTLDANSSRQVTSIFYTLEPARLISVSWPRPFDLLDAITVNEDTPARQDFFQGSVQSIENYGVVTF